MHYTLESEGEKFTNRVVGMTISSKQVNNVILKGKNCKNVQLVLKLFTNNK